MEENATATLPALQSGGGAEHTDADDNWQLVAAVASAALEPHLREATGAAAAWIADRWPGYVEKTLLPALSDAVHEQEAGGDAGRSSPDGKTDRVRLGVIAGAAAAVLGTAGIVFARR